MTKNNEYKLKVQLIQVVNAPALEAEYSTFKLNDESDRYRLTIGGHSGTAGNYE